MASTTTARSNPPQLHRRRSSRAAPGEKFDDYIIRRKAEMEQQHKKVSIYKSPLLVGHYFIMYIFYEVRSVFIYLYGRGRPTLRIIVTLLGMISIAYQIQGPHQMIIQQIQRIGLWYGYWVLLGIASAFGLGTGLHTFLLFLGPYIAEVTRAAYECQGANFLTRDGVSYRLQCHDTTHSVGTAVVSLWDIYQKIQWESFAWGAGTALGELPPYFVARAVALSGGKSEELKELEDHLQKSSSSSSSSSSKEDYSLKQQMTHLIYNGMNRLGFFGILLFASIPNPLFDLAGITCGHFLVPFATFFGATFIGKACVKASLQSFIVILTFSNDTLNTFLETLKRIAPTLHNIVEKVIHEQTNKIGQSNTDEFGNEQMNLFGIAWNIFLSLMLCYFIISSIESLGLAYMKREHQEEMKQLEQRRHRISIVPEEEQEE